MVTASTNQRLRTIILIIALMFVVKVCHTRIFHYLLYLEIIEKNLEIVQIEVEQLFQTIRDLYEMIFEMVDDLNEIFGYSHLATVWFCFYFLLSDLNFVYFWLHCQSSPDQIGKLL